MQLSVPLYTLQVKVYDSTQTDRHNNPVDAWGDPVDWPVYAWASGANVEPPLADRDLSQVLWTVYAPAGGTAPTDKDLVVLGGLEYPVEGEPLDYSHDPFGDSEGGIVVLLKRSEG